MCVEMDLSTRYWGLRAYGRQNVADRNESIDGSGPALPDRFAGPRGGGACEGMQDGAAMYNAARKAEDAGSRPQGLNIRVESPMSPASRTLIAASQAAMEAVYPPHEIFSLSPEELATPNTMFFVARLGKRPAGCVGLVNCMGFGEIKRLYVDPRARGHGIGQALMAGLERAASDIGLGVLRLETGPELASAVRLYRGLGYVERDAFGDYADAPCSLFMEKRLF
jgi:putative acetyltransferase